MNELINLIIYIFKNYPKVDELSKPRLVKLIYLIDWKHTVVNGIKATSIEWYFNHYGPYVETVIDLIKDNPDIFNVETRINAYGGVSDKIKLISKQEVQIENSVKESADFIISNTSQMNWTNFIDLVYSTYPIKTNSKYTHLNLVEEARKFEEFKHNN